MHKLNKPSLLDDNDDDDVEMDNYSRNRFMKNKTYPEKSKNDFQKELESKVSQRRTPTPKSIETDSDVAFDDDDNSISFRSSNNLSSSKKSFGNSDWQPGIRKSPVDLKMSSKYENDLPLNKTIRSGTLKQKPNFADDADISLNQTRRFQDRKSLEALNEDDDDDVVYPDVIKTQPKLGAMRPNASTSSSYNDTDDKFKSKKPSDLEDISQNKSSRFLRSSKSPTNVDVTDGGFGELNKKPRKLNFDMEKTTNDLSEESYSSKPWKTKSSKEMEKEYSLPSSKTVQSKPDKFKEIDDWKKANSSFDDDNTVSSSSRYMKPKKSLSDDNDLNKSSSLFDDNSLKSSKFMKAPNKTKKLSDLDDNDDDNEEFQSSKFMKNKGQKSKDELNASTSFYDVDSYPSDFMKKNKSKDGGSMTESSSKKHDDKLFLRGSSNHMTESSSGTGELLHSTKFISPKDHDQKSDDVKTKPKRSKFLNSSDKSGDVLQPKNEPPTPQERHFKRTISPYDDQTIDDRESPEFHYPFNRGDSKNRSIRFEDERKQSDFTKSPKAKSRESINEEIPRKSPRSLSNSRESLSEKRPLSPPSSLCEETVRDPVAMKLEALKRRREEKRRESDLKFETEDHRISSKCIDLVANSQEETDKTLPPKVEKTKTSRPPSAKYKNVTPKVLTRMSLKSVSLDNVQNIDYDPLSDRSFTNSQTIRDTAYMNWYMNKMNDSKLNKQNQKRPPTNSEDDEKMKHVKMEENKAAYEAWMKNKHQYFKDLKKKKSEPIQPADNKENKSAELAFEIWKKKKEEYLKEQTKKDSEVKKQKEKQKLTEKEVKKQQSKESVAEWEVKKQNELKQQKTKMEKEKDEQRKKEEKAKMKEVRAEEAYRKWEEQVSLKEQQNQHFDKCREAMMNNRRAWRPSNNTVRYGR